MFFFITFVNVVRWCNLRVRPRRETRGVSRSKCADLITACVPVSWATAIIVSETVDAADYYDGFGTGEIVVGIRAYQWGWEYFYPKNIDLNYNVTPSYSSLIGNSIKYSAVSTSSSDSQVLWKYYQKPKGASQSSTPAHLILLPSDKLNFINFTDFKNIGWNTLKDSLAFKKIQYFSKTNLNSLYASNSDITLNYNKLTSLYNRDMDVVESINYGLKRQHNLNTLASATNTYQTTLDSKSTQKYYNYSLNSPLNKVNTSSGNNTTFKSAYYNTPVSNSNLNLAGSPFSLVNQFTRPDHKNSNPFKLNSSIKPSPASLSTATQLYLTANYDINALTPRSQINGNLLSPIFQKTFDLKSSDLQFLSSERSTRLLNVFDLNQVSTNFSPLNTKPAAIWND
jgi:heme/copper-type cytochrome/quinol oxidase subunit 2